MENIRKYKIISLIFIIISVVSIIAAFKFYNDVIIEKNKINNVNQYKVKYEELHLKVENLEEQINNLKSENFGLEINLSNMESLGNRFENAINELLKKFSEEEIKDMYISGDIYEMKINELDSNGHGTGEGVFIENSGEVKSPYKNFSISIHSYWDDIRYSILLTGNENKEWREYIEIKLIIENYEDYEYMSSGGEPSTSYDEWRFKDVESGTEINITIPEELAEKLNFDSNKVTVLVK